MEPDPEDRNWLLLPSVLLDKRADVIRPLVKAHPEIYPGFYTFPTPDKVKKRNLLNNCMSSLNRTIGMTLFDERISSLLERDDRDTEVRLLKSADGAADRIGVGMALGFFRRTRRRKAFIEQRRCF